MKFWDKKKDRKDKTEAPKKKPSRSFEYPVRIAGTPATLQFDGCGNPYVAVSDDLAEILKSDVQQRRRSIDENVPPIWQSHTYEECLNRERQGRKSIDNVA
jgi:hypothetical protein